MFNQYVSQLFYLLIKNWSKSIKKRSIIVERRLKIGQFYADYKIVILSESDFDFKIWMVAISGLRLYPECTNPDRDNPELQ